MTKRAEKIKRKKKKNSVSHGRRERLDGRPAPSSESHRLRSTLRNRVIGTRVCKGGARAMSVSCASWSDLHVRLEHGREAGGVHAEVALQHVVLLVAVLHEVRVAADEGGHVVLHARVVRAVHGHGALERVVDRVAADVAVGDGAGQVEVDRVAAQIVRLPVAADLDVLHAHDASLERHNMSAEHLRLRGVVSLHDDISREQADLVAHVDVVTVEVPLLRSVREGQRLGEGQRALVGCQRLDESPLGLLPSLVRGDDDLLAGSEVNVLRGRNARPTPPAAADAPPRYIAVARTKL